MSIEKTIFFKHFKGVYGERWDHLLPALLRPGLQVARLNKFSVDYRDGKISQRFLNLNTFGGLNDCFIIGDEAPDIVPERTADGLLDCYILDPASVFVAESLLKKNLKNDHSNGARILDMCAAPGGKSLILVEDIIDKGELIANEISQNRRENLTQVIRQYVPQNIRERLWVKGKDGVSYGRSDKEQYDRILLDAPCSGERHLLGRTKDLESWTPRRSFSLSIRQYSLLSSAWDSLKRGGFLVYSTCSINPQENDEIIEKLIKRKKDEVSLVLNDNFSFLEKTQFGYQFFPDKCGFGPMFFTKIQKV